ncbi:hypothetical protein F2Q69_00046264 [Brassica cretica]|uniref:Protein kinase domain-containing protein n=1 Tax=Brassica cretica TaxID=69181 RepID=A0A8S9PQF2_BRACR|nr:hypothetical protein F2Q69_00046264 [Brassica cretica]
MHSNEEFIKFLGEGSYGSVHLVRYTNPDDDDGSSFLTAVKNSGYPRIITCFGDCLEEGLSSYGNRVYKLLLEYASEGSLNAFLNNFPDRKLHEPLIKDFTRMILEGLVSIHGHGYVHCDMKSDNLLVFPSSTEHSSSRYELKISDFGNCLEVGQVPHSWAKDFPWVGTPNYMLPESVRDGVANKTLDLWSVGCLVLEMYTGVVPWEGVKVSDIAARLRCGEAPKIPQSLPSDAKDFIETCFSRNPEERGSAYELLFHPFLPRPQVAEEEKKTGEKKLNSFLLRLLKLKIRRTTSMKKSAKDAVLVADKESLKLRMNPHFKRTLNKVLSLKNHAFEEIHRLQFSVGSLRV